MAQQAILFQVILVLGDIVKYIEIYANGYYK